jgi:hypothetical protein
VAKFEIKAGASIDVLTQAELDASLSAQRPPYQAVTDIRLPVLYGVAAGGVLSMGGDAAAHTPDQGYVWSIRHISIEGLTAGATPDVVNIIRAGRTFWKLSGAPPSAETWGRGEFMVNAGETLSYTNFGAFASTAQIIISGTAWQCPAQFKAELAL